MKYDISMSVEGYAFFSVEAPSELDAEEMVEAMHEAGTVPFDDSYELHILVVEA